jgi:hypothetical protein
MITTNIILLAFIFALFIGLANIAETLKEIRELLKDKNENT